MTEVISNAIDIESEEFKALKRQRDQIQLLKNKILEKNYEQLVMKNKKDQTYVTLHLVDKTPMSFHFYAIFEPAIDELSGIDGIVSEVFVDSKNKHFYVKRNMKEVQFSDRNIEGMLKYAKRKELFDFIESEHIKGLFEKIYALGEEIYITEKKQKVGYHGWNKEYPYKLTRFFQDYVEELYQYESLLKIGFTSNDIFLTKRDFQLDFTKTKPHQILGISKGTLRTIHYLAEKHERLSYNVLKFFLLPPLEKWRTYGQGFYYKQKQRMFATEYHPQIVPLSESWRYEISIQRFIDGKYKPIADRAYYGLEDFYVLPVEKQKQIIQKYGVQYLNLVKELEKSNDYYGLEKKPFTRFDFAEYIKLAFLRDYIFPTVLNEEGEVCALKLEQYFKKYFGKVKTSYGDHRQFLENSIGMGFFSQEIIQYHLNNLPQLLKYLFFKVHVEQGITSPSLAVTTLSDYYRMSRKMNAPNIERYPKSLKLVHDIASMNHKIVLDNIQREKWKKIADKNIEKYAYQPPKKIQEELPFEIIYPDKPEELVAEGNSLNHCVKSYIDSVLKRTTDVVFCRKSDELQKSYYTVEIRNGKITQVRGRFNEPATQEVKEFMKLYAKEKELVY